jgi:hypothetical protein
MKGQREVHIISFTLALRTVSLFMCDLHTSLVWRMRQSKELAMQRDADVSEESSGYRTRRRLIGSTSSCNAMRLDTQPWNPAVPHARVRHIVFKS